MINLDTHIVVDLTRNKIRDAERQLLDSNAWGISGIVLWELQSLYRKERIGVPLRHPIMQRMLNRMTIWPITPEVAMAVGELDFHSDPADQIIAATSIAHDIPLLTRDMRILRSKVVPLALT